jgi:hypothetical protein
MDGVPDKVHVLKCVNVTFSLVTMTPVKHFFYKEEQDETDEDKKIDIKS